MKVFVDSNIPMYVAGAQHEHRDPARRFLERVEKGQIEASTSTEVLQEILYRYSSIGRRDLASGVYDLFAEACPVVLDVTLADTDRARNLISESSGISPRDAIHAAVMLNHDIEWIATFDSDFDRIPGIRRRSFAKSLPARKLSAESVRRFRAARVGRRSFRISAQTCCYDALKAMASIFICYRREDSIAYAGRLYDRLVDHFGARHQVFMDLAAIKPGDDFVERIEQTVASCCAMIAVIGRQWLTVTDEAGHGRLHDPEDFVHIEIRAALDRKIRVIPALVGGARMPTAQDLPPALSPLARREAVEISDRDFRHSVSRLIEGLDAALNEAAQPVTNAAPSGTCVNPKDRSTYVWISTGEISRWAVHRRDDEAFDDEKPAREVTITKGFWIGQTLVTQGAYQRVMGRESEPLARGPSFPWRPSLGPKRMSIAEPWEGDCRRRPNGKYASRAGDQRSRPGDVEAIAWYRGNSGQKTHEVGQKEPNACGDRRAIRHTGERVGVDIGFVYGQSFHCGDRPGQQPASAARGLVERHCRRRPGLLPFQVPALGAKRHHRFPVRGGIRPSLTRSPARHSQTLSPLFSATSRFPSPPPQKLRSKLWARDRGHSSDLRSTGLGESSRLPWGNVKRDGPGQARQSGPFSVEGDQRWRKLPYFTE